MKKVAIIGAGFSGLASAATLSHEGYEVTVFEKNQMAGGRARQWRQEGFTFDMGPSWYWMPDVFEKFFNRFDSSPGNYYSLVRLDPSYRVYFSKDEVIDIPADFEALCQLFNDIEPGSGKQLIKFLEEARYKYQVGIHDLVYKPGISVTELLDWRLLTGALRLNVFSSVSSYVRKYFKDERLIQLLEFPVLFLGAPPSKTPALYTLMNYADMVLGTWYPLGGMYKIIEGMQDLAEQVGVDFQFGRPVDQVCMNGGRAKGLVVNDRLHEFDFIVAGADYHHVEQKLLPPAYRHYDEKYWDSRTMAPSSLIFYVGLDKKINLQHHNLFFDQDFALHTREIYNDPTWPTNPLFYVCCPSKTDPSVAPAGHENIFILIPVATGLQDTEETREKYFDMVINRLESLLGESFRENIVLKRSYAHNDFISDYNSYKGNAYGLANTLRQTANLKPSIINKRVGNLFYTGQLTVPGPGVPPSIISGQVVAQELIKQDQKLKPATRQPYETTV